MEGKCAMCGAEGNAGDMCANCNVAMEEKCPNCGNAKSKCECGGGDSAEAEAEGGGEEGM